MQNPVTNLEILKVEKPIVEFNHEAMKAELLQIVGEWKGFIIQEDDLAFTKDLLADLNKKKKAIDDFRKNTKKELSEPIALFEAQCKELVGIIDGVYGDIKEQYDTFEEKRREQKLIQVQEWIAIAGEESQLPESYRLRIELKPQYLNKTMKEADILKDLNDHIDKLKSEWIIQQSRVEQITMQCELVSERLGLNIPLDPQQFTHHEDLRLAKPEIEAAGQRAKKAQDEALKAIQEKAKQEAEENAQQQIDEKAKQIAQELIAEANERTEQTETEKDQAMELVQELGEEISQIIPTETDDIQKTPHLLRIYTNDIQLEALKAYMARVDIPYEIIA